MCDRSLSESLRNRQIRATTAIFALILLFEIVLTFSLRTLGWPRTKNAMLLMACIVVTSCPLLIAFVIVAKNRFRFGLRTLMIAVALFALFLATSAIPLQKYRAARRTNAQLIAAKAGLNAGVKDWDQWYADLGLVPPPTIAPTEAISLLPWLTPFTKEIADIPPDEVLRSISLSSDTQIRILVDNCQRLSSLQSIEIFSDATSGLTSDGLTILQTAIPRFKHLEVMFTNDVVVPRHWYRSLTNIRVLYVFGEGSSRGTPFPAEHLTDIASLPNLEVLMVLGYAMTDADAQVLAGSRSIKRVLLRGTAVTSLGEDLLTDESLGRKVFRN